MRALRKVAVRCIGPDLALRYQIPKGVKLSNAPVRRVPGDDGGIDGADRNAGNPIGQDVRFMHGLIDAGLIGAECAAPLQHESDAIASVRAAGVQGSTLAQRIWWRRRRDIVHGRTPAGNAVEFASLQEPHDAAMTDLVLAPVLETGFLRHTIVETILEARATRCSGLLAHDPRLVDQQG